MSPFAGVFLARACPGQAARAGARDPPLSANAHVCMAARDPPIPVVGSGDVTREEPLSSFYCRDAGIGGNR